MKQLFVLSLIFSLLFVGCVSQDKYSADTNSLQLEKQILLKEKNDALDNITKLNSAIRNCEGEIQKKEGEFNQCINNISRQEEMVKLFSESRDLDIESTKISIANEPKNKLIDSINITSVSLCKTYFDTSKEVFCGDTDYYTKKYSFLSKYGNATNNADCIEKANKVLKLYGERTQLCLDYNSDAKARCIAAYDSSSYDNWLEHKIKAAQTWEKYEKVLSEFSKAVNAVALSCLSK